MPGMASPIAPWLARVGEFAFAPAGISRRAFPTARPPAMPILLDMVAMTRAHYRRSAYRARSSGQEDRIRPASAALPAASPVLPAQSFEWRGGAAARDRTLRGRAARSSSWAATGRPRSRARLRGARPPGGAEAADRLGGQLLLGVGKLAP
jgi:hypothetical protein